MLHASSFQTSFRFPLWLSFSFVVRVARLSVIFEYIALTSNSVNSYLQVSLQLLPQSLDMYVDSSRHNAVGIPPNRLEQGIARENPARIVFEKLQDLCFFRGEVYLGHRNFRQLFMCSVELG
jgi:hypothetical protein